MKNPILFFLMALGFVTLFTNCQTDEPLPSEGMLDEAFYLDHQFQVQVTNDLTVTFEEVTEDSRCPCNADCFSAGQIGVKIKMQTNGVALSKLFTLDGFDGPQAGVFETDFEGYHIKLVDVLPYPCNGEPNSNDAYSIEVLVTED